MVVEKGKQHRYNFFHMLFLKSTAGMTGS